MKLHDTYTQFPNISFQEFQKIPDIATRREIAKRNKILNTDAYNRTMDAIKGERGDRKETYVLTFRKSSNKTHNVVYGIKQHIDSIFRTPITQTELEFAKDFYAYQEQKGGNGKFNTHRWQEIIDTHGGYVPLEISAVDDGTALKVGEPVMTVTGASELASVFEPLLLRVFYPSAVATQASMIASLLGEGRVVEFGKRSAINEDMHLDASEALIVGMGMSKTSNDVASSVLDILSDGTTAHRFFMSYENEDEAMEEAVSKSDKIGILVDSVEAFAGIDKVIALKQKYRTSTKIIAPRLDSGDLKAQTIYALQKMHALGFDNPATDKIIVSDISRFEEIEAIETAVKEIGIDPKKYVIYGLGGLLVVKDKTRDILSAGYKLSHTPDGPAMKFSNDAGKVSLPGIPNVEIHNNTRTIVQESEPLQGERLLKPLYKNGQFFYDRPTLENIIEAQKTLKKTKKFLNYDSMISQKTQEMQIQCRKKAGLVNNII